MKKQKMYEVILDAGENCIKHYGIYKSIKEVKEQVIGNGEILKITEVNLPLDTMGVFNALRNAGFGHRESNLIQSFLERNYENMV